MTGDVTSSIGGSAFTFRDLHHEFERYRWEKEEGASGGALYLRGEGGPYPKIVVGLEEFEGRLVVSEMRLFDPADRQVMQGELADFVTIGGKIRACSVHMQAFGAAGNEGDDGVVTTLKVNWESIDAAPGPLSRANDQFEGIATATTLPMPCSLAIAADSANLAPQSCGIVADAADFPPRSYWIVAVSREFAPQSP